MFSVYILELSNGQFYIGYTSNLEKRIEYHKNGWSKYTKSRRPLRLLYHESYASKATAMSRESYLKSLKNKSILRDIMKSDGGPIV